MSHAIPSWHVTQGRQNSQFYFRRWVDPARAASGLSDTSDDDGRWWDCARRPPTVWWFSDTCWAQHRTSILIGFSVNVTRLELSFSFLCIYSSKLLQFLKMLNDNTSGLAGLVNIWRNNILSTMWCNIKLLKAFCCPGSLHVSWYQGYWWIMTLSRQIF